MIEIYKTKILEIDSRVCEFMNAFIYPKCGLKLEIAGNCSFEFVYV